MKTQAWGAVGVCFASAALACGTGPEGAAAAPAAPASVESASQLVTIAAGKHRHRVTADAAALAGAVKRGYLDAEIDGSGPAASTFVYAQFWRDEASDAGASDAGNDDCTTVKVGACEYQKCTAGGPPIVAVNESAGTLDVSGGKLPKLALTTSKRNGLYYEYYAASAELAAGDTVSFSATGGVFPAFGPFSLTMPAAITLTAPLPGPAGTYHIGTEHPLKVTWTGGQTGATVTLQANVGSQFAFGCYWNADAGEGHVPVEVMTGLAGAASTTISWAQELEPALEKGPLLLGNTGMWDEAKVVFH